eukprot:6209128-Prymnesium_polylepis.2
MAPKQGLPPKPQGLPPRPTSQQKLSLTPPASRPSEASATSCGPATSSPDPGGATSERRRHMGVARCAATRRMLGRHAAMHSIRRFAARRAAQRRRRMQQPAAASSDPGLCALRGMQLRAARTAKRMETARLHALHRSPVV